MERARPRPIVFQHRVGDKARATDEHQRKKHPLCKAEVEQAASFGKSKDDADHCARAGDPGQKFEAEAESGGEIGVVEEEMARPEIEEAAHGDIEVGPTDEDHGGGHTDRGRNGHKPQPCQSIGIPIGRAWISHHRHSDSRARGRSAPRAQALRQTER